MRKIVGKGVFFFIWLLCTGVFMLIAYWLMAAVPSNQETGYFTRLVSVLHTPFANYFNNYTPIGMILAFIIVELIFGVIGIYKMASMSGITEGDDAERDNVSYDTFMESDVMEEPKVQFVEQIDEEPLIEESPKKERQISEKEDDSEEILLKEDVFLKLFNSGYAMNQINAMMELISYIPNIDETQLMKMISPSMSEEEIRSYIEMFFG